MGDLSTDITHEEILIPASDGFGLAASRFSSSQSKEGVVLINSAAGVKRRFYNDLAGFLAENNFTVYTYDYRGIGESSPGKLRGFQAKMSEWGLLDMNGMMAYIIQKHPEAKYSLIGHSIGGQILGLSKFNPNIKNAITVGAQKGNSKYWDGVWRLNMILLWYFVIPVASRLFGYFPSKIIGAGDDLPKGVALEWASWGRSKNWFFGLLLEAYLNFSGFSGKLMGVSISDDNYAPIRSVNAIMEEFKKAEITRRHIYPDDLGVNHIGHFNLFRKKFKESFWKEMSDFLKS